jgi:hypothetical protein
VTKYRLLFDTRKQVLDASKTERVHILLEKSPLFITFKIAEGINESLNAMGAMCPKLSCKEIATSANLFQKLYAAV